MRKMRPWNEEKADAFLRQLSSCRAPGTWKYWEKVSQVSQTQTSRQAGQPLCGWECSSVSSSTSVQPQEFPLPAHLILKYLKCFLRSCIRYVLLKAIKPVTLQPRGLFCKWNWLHRTIAVWEAFLGCRHDSFERSQAFQPWRPFFFSRKKGKTVNELFSIFFSEKNHKSPDTYFSFFLHT